MKNEKINDFYVSAKSFADLIKKKESDIYQILSKYETHQTIADEISRSVRTLNNFGAEFSEIKKPLENINFSTFFPLNLPLYSLVIFGIAPSAFATNVFIRPPEVMHDVLKELWDMLEVEKYFPELSLKPTPRHIFMDLYASDSEVIIFTGKYQNALAIHEICPDSLLIYNGSGINPFILFEDADTKLAAQKAVEMRCFNSGQDCAGPDAFFVHKSLATNFINELENLLDNVNVGAPSDPQNSVGYTIKRSYIEELKIWKAKHQNEICYGGEINEEENLVHPAVFKRKISPLDNEEFHEFFAPFFYVLEYDDISSLKKLLLSDKFKERGMYISVFGKNESVEKELTFVKLLRNQIVNDVEIGNQEYGGFGPHANFLLYKGKKYNHPVLISRDLHQLLT